MVRLAVLLIILVLPPVSGAALQRDEITTDLPPETFGHWKMVSPGEPPQEVLLLNFAGEDWLLPISGAAEHLNANQGWFRFAVVTGLPVATCEALDDWDFDPGTFAVCAVPPWDDFGGMYTEEFRSNGEHISHGYIGIDYDEYDNEPSSATGRRMSSIRHELLHVMGLDHSRGAMVGAALDGTPLHDGQTCVWSVRMWGANPSPPPHCPGSSDMVRLEQLYAHTHND